MHVTFRGGLAAAISDLYPLPLAYVDLLTQACQKHFMTRGLLI